MGAAMDTLMREMGELDENADPRRVGAFFRRFSDLAGLEMGPRMEDALSRLEAGQEIDELESELGRPRAGRLARGPLPLEESGRSGAAGGPRSIRSSTSSEAPGIGPPVEARESHRPALGEERRDAFDWSRHRGAGRLHAATRVHQRGVVAVRRHLRRVDPLAAPASSGAASPPSTRPPRRWRSKPRAIAIRRAGLDARDIDEIVVATDTQEIIFPDTACFVQHAIGAREVPAYTLGGSGCAGFIQALDLAASRARDGGKRILVIGVEVLTKIMDWSDRNTCVLFGDAAAAAVVSADSPKAELLAAACGTDGSQIDILKLEVGGIRTPGDPRAPRAPRAPQHRHARPRGLPPRRRSHDAGLRRSAGEGRHDRRRRRPGGAAPGQPAHHPRRRQEPRGVDGQGVHQRPRVRQHRLGVGPARALRGRVARAASAPARWSSSPRSAPASTGRRRRCATAPETRRGDDACCAVSRASSRSASRRSSAARAPKPRSSSACGSPPPPSSSR